MVKVATSSMPNNKPVGLVLAGGRSRRFGSDKALFHQPKQPPQVQQMVTILRPLVTHIFVSVNVNNQQAITELFQNDADVTVLADVPPFIDQGPLGGLYAVCARLKRPTTFLMVPTDYPDLETDTLAELLTQPCYPVVAGQSHQTIAHFQTDQAQIRAFLETGQRRIRLFLENSSHCQPLTLAANKAPQFLNHNQRSV